jgi:hypothetical protein
MPGWGGGVVNIRLFLVTFTSLLSLFSSEEATSSGIISGLSGVVWVVYWAVTGEVAQCVEELASLLPVDALFMRVTSRSRVELSVTGGVDGISRLINECSWWFCSITTSSWRDSPNTWYVFWPAVFGRAVPICMRIISMMAVCAANKTHAVKAILTACGFPTIIIHGGMWLGSGCTLMISGWVKVNNWTKGVG